MPSTSPCMRKKSGSALENTTTRAPSSRSSRSSRAKSAPMNGAVDQVARRVVDDHGGDTGTHLAPQHIVGHGAWSTRSIVRLHSTLVPFAREG